MDPKTTRQTNDTTVSSKLYLALELSQAEWKLGFTVGLGQAPRLRTLKARNREGLMREIALAKERFGLPQEAGVFSCYEAGRDGMWLHRFLEAQGVNNLVVDSASIEVNRRFRRAKTDRLDVGKLLNMLVRYHEGEPKVWSVVHVPSVAEEDQRQMHRELTALKREQTHHINRMKGILISQGLVMEVQTDFLEQLKAVKVWDGSSILPGLQTLLVREYERLVLVRAQIHQIEVMRQEVLRTSQDPAIVQIRCLLQLKGIGVNSAWVYVMEFFSWRGFHNRRELGSLAGLTPTPYESGDSSRECGISKAGNRPVRAMAIEIAWSWLRNQPESALSRWYQRRFAKGSSRVRRIGIVALARKLLIALWRYVEEGILPEGAQLKAA
ncbi:MAG: IS110 family transposase [Anaerolineales bacterium]|nr:MAG: IS110 family transposase [Anaerolineales bacterium]